MREVITVNVGGCGVQFGDSVWKHYCKQHGVSKDGKYSEDASDMKRFFEETQSGCVKARTLMLDTDTATIDALRNASHAKLYHEHSLISTKDGTATQFATAFDQMPLLSIHGLRKIAGECDHLQGFIFNHSMSGGTGAGFTAYCMQQLTMARYFEKKSKISFSVFPSDGTNDTELLNMAMSMQCLRNHSDITFVFDNDRLYDICRRKLSVKEPSYDDMNMVMSKIQSSFTYTMRYPNYVDIDMYDYVTNLMPLPRLQFITAAMAPCLPTKTDGQLDKIYASNAMATTLCNGFVRLHYNHCIESLQYEPPIYSELMELIYRSYLSVNDLNKKYKKTYYDTSDLDDLFAMCLSDEYQMAEFQSRTPLICGTDGTEFEHQLMACTVHAHCVEPGNKLQGEPENIDESAWKRECPPFVDWIPTGLKAHCLGFLASPSDDIMASNKKCVITLCNDTAISNFLRQKMPLAKLPDAVKNDKSKTQDSETAVENLSDLYTQYEKLLTGDFDSDDDED